MSERYSVIVDAVRSPIGLKNGEMIGMRPDDIAAQVVKGLMARNPAVKPEMIDDLILGCAFPEGNQGMLMGRGVALLAGLPITTSGSTVNRFCGSSMDALHQMSTSIMAGDKEIGIAAGVEDMFGVPMGGYNPDFNPELYEMDYYMGMGEQLKIWERSSILAARIRKLLPSHPTKKLWLHKRLENLTMRSFPLRSRE